MKGYTVVVADDDAQVLNTVTQLLESAGHKVVGKASTGEEAMWLNQTLMPDVVLVDIQMPGLNGLEAAKRMLKVRPTAIVMCTAYFEERLIDSASMLGVHAYIVKPCRLSNMLAAINMAVSRFQETKLLRGEIEALKEAVAARKWIEQAKGIIMQTRQLSEESAHRFLQQESQRQSRPLAEMAKAIVLAKKAFTPGVYGERRLVRTSR